MRIVALSFFSGLVERGVEVYVGELAGRLGKDVEVITGRALGVSPYSGKEPVLLRRFYLDAVSLKIKEATRTILKNLETNPPDILYPVNNGWQSILAKRFCRVHKTKLILAGHSGRGWDDRVNLWLKPDVFIAFSQAQAQWAQKVSRGARIETIPHGVAVDTFKPGESSLNLKLQRPIFVTVSALSLKSRAGETVKNVDLTIEALARLGKGSLLLIGQGQDEARIDQLAKEKLGDRRYQRVAVSHNSMQEYYRAADVFTLASSPSEAFGISLLEALASNLPVVVQDDVIRREIVGNAGVFIKNPNDISEYSQGLADALKNDWNEKPRTQAQKFSWEQVIGQYKKLFQDIVIE